MTPERCDKIIDGLYYLSIVLVVILIILVIAAYWFVTHTNFI